jgi:hypothetical protein
LDPSTVTLDPPVDGALLRTTLLAIEATAVKAESKLPVRTPTLNTPARAVE